MAELYNKVGLGLITWSPVSLGLVLGTSEEQIQLVTKLAFKVSLKKFIVVFIIFNKRIRAPPPPPPSQQCLPPTLV